MGSKGRNAIPTITTIKSNTSLESHSIPEALNRLFYMELQTGGCPFEREIPSLQHRQKHALSMQRTDGLKHGMKHHRTLPSPSLMNMASPPWCGKHTPHVCLQLSAILNPRHKHHCSSWRCVCTTCLASGVRCFLFSTTLDFEIELYLSMVCSTVLHYSSLCFTIWGLSRKNQP